jgi:hypothetical protein
MTKLGEVEMRLMIAVIQFRTSSLLVCSLKTRRLTCIKNYNFPIDFTDVKFNLLTLWEEHRLRVLEKRVLRRIFGSKRERGWRELHD